MSPVVVSTDALAAATRGAVEAVSRRRSLLMLGGVSLATGLAGPLGAEAKPSPAKKAKKKAKKTCKRQVSQCTAILDERCDENDCDADSLERVLGCCQSFRSCSAGAVLDCLFTGAT